MLTMPFTAFYLSFSADYDVDYLGQKPDYCRQMATCFILRLDWLNIFGQ